MTAARTYLDEAIAHLAAARDREAPAIDAAADAIVATVRADGRVYVFGTGHSHMMAEELHYRAGGLAITVPILATPLMLHEGAVASTQMERMEGIVRPILERYPIGARDVLIVSSNSGVNAAPLEAAAIGRERGATVIALTSRAYSESAAAGRQTLAGGADIVLDNGTPPGDAAVAIEGIALRAGPLSTVIGAALLNAVYVEVAARLAQEAEGAPIWLSANMDGAKESNAGLLTRYRPGNPHL